LSELLFWGYHPWVFSQQIDTVPIYSYSLNHRVNLQPFLRRLMDQYCNPLPQRVIMNAIDQIGEHVKVDPWILIFSVFSLINSLEIELRVEEMKRNNAY
jgi:hypothetical protein